MENGDGREGGSMGGLSVNKCKFRGSLLGGGRSFSPHFPKKSETKNLKIGNIENGYTGKREGKGHL